MLRKYLRVFAWNVMVFYFQNTYAYLLFMKNKKNEAYLSKKLNKSCFLTVESCILCNRYVVMTV